MGVSNVFFFFISLSKNPDAKTVKSTLSSCVLNQTPHCIGWLCVLLCVVVSCFVFGVCVCGGGGVVVVFVCVGCCVCVCCILERVEGGVPVLQISSLDSLVMAISSSVLVYPKKKKKATCSPTYPPPPPPPRPPLSLYLSIWVKEEDLV